MNNNQTKIFITQKMADKINACIQYENGIRDESSDQKNIAIISDLLTKLRDETKLNKCKEYIDNISDNTQHNDMLKKYIEIYKSLTIFICLSFENSKRYPLDKIVFDTTYNVTKLMEDIK